MNPCVCAGITSFQHDPSRRPKNWNMEEDWMRIAAPMMERGQLLEGILTADYNSAEMRKNSFALCCVIFCLLSAVPENQGNKLQESLNCFLLYPSEIITCKWLEDIDLESLVNMTLLTTSDKSSVPKTICKEKSVTRGSKRNTWTCHIPWEGTETDDIKISLVPEKNLETRPNSEEEKDEAKPQNLRCDDTNGIITCSWQIRREISESITFGLFYDNDMKECQPKCQQENLKYCSCHCKISTDSHLNTSALLKTISVKPSNKNPLSFMLCHVYKLPARNLTINETNKGEAFTVTWTNDIEENNNFQDDYHYELCYWNQRDLEIKNPDVCLGKSINIPSNKEHKVMLQLGQLLEPSSNYSLMVRVRLESKLNHCYKGPWSEWSRVHTITTKAVPNHILLYVLIPICVIILVIFAFWGYKTLVRYKKQWDEKIPNPNKSAIIKSLQKTKNGSFLSNKQHLYVEPSKNIMMWTSSNSNESPHFYYNQNNIDSLDGELIPEEDTKCFILDLNDLTKENYPTATFSEEYKPFTDLTNEQESKDIKDSTCTSSISKEYPHLYYNEQKMNSLESEHVSEEDIECILNDLIKEDYPTVSTVDDIKAFTDLKSEQENKNINDSQFTFSAFDGPYLFSECNQ
ncbi:uncharacterized protein [Pyxicephalus adspersus]|uniref:uncharacterized protein isoform X2 n=1 Tax=Pyxicephalus adspersus TaxID=30357 RepID=UPI003B5C0D79